MHHFTQLGFTDNLELKEEDSNRNQPNTLLVAELRQLIGRQSSELREFFFFQYVWRTDTGKALSRRSNIMREKVNLKRYLFSCPATAILLQNAFLKRNHSCVVLGE